MEIDSIWKDRLPESDARIVKEHVVQSATQGGIERCVVSKASPRAESVLKPKMPMTVALADNDREAEYMTSQIRERRKNAGLLDRQERTVAIRTPLDWTSEQKSDVSQYKDRRTTEILIEQDTEHHRKGTRLLFDRPDLETGDLIVENEKREMERFTPDRPETFSVNKKQDILLAKGDQIRFTKDTVIAKWHAHTPIQDRIGKNVNYDKGELAKIGKFTRDGGVELSDGTNIGTTTEGLSINYGYAMTADQVTEHTKPDIGIAKESQFREDKTKDKAGLLIKQSKEEAHLYHEALGGEAGKDMKSQARESQEFSKPVPTQARDLEQQKEYERIARDYEQQKQQEEKERERS